MRSAKKIKNTVTAMFPEQAMRFNAGKPQFSMVLSAPEALNGLANVFAYGAQKYARDNWMKGFPYSQLVDSLMRHLLAYYNGEDRDSESGLPHVDHILWNALILSQEFYTRKDFDDRPVVKEVTCSVAGN
jgi:hypothetical protein